MAEDWAQTDKKNAGVVALAVVLGFFGLSLVFSDLGPGENFLSRIMVGTAFFLFSGAVIAYLHPTRWLIALLVSWGGVAVGGFLILIALARYGREAFNAVEPPYISAGLIMFFGSLGLTLLGAFIGKSLPRLRSKNVTVSQNIDAKDLVP